MSGNSNSQGRASGFDVPYLGPGWEIEEDADAGVWVARKGKAELRGRNNEELRAAHAAHLDQLGRELLDICNYAANHGYTPPPRDWQPPRT